MLCSFIKTYHSSMNSFIPSFDLSREWRVHNRCTCRKAQSELRHNGRCSSLCINHPRYAPRRKPAEVRKNKIHTINNNNNKMASGDGKPSRFAEIDDEVLTYLINSSASKNTKKQIKFLVSILSE